MDPEGEKSCGVDDKLVMTDAELWWVMAIKHGDTEVRVRVEGSQACFFVTMNSSSGLKAGRIASEGLEKLL